MTPRRIGPQPSVLEALERHARTGVVLAEDTREAGYVVRSINDAAAAMLGRPASEVVGRALLEISPTTADRVAQVRALLEAGTSAVDEVAIRRPDGSEVWIEADVAAIPGSRDVVIVARDVTDRRAAQRRLARTEELLQLATAVGRVGIWEWDLHTNGLTWNATLRELIGVGPEAPASVEHWFERVHPDDLTVARRAVDELFAAGETAYRVVRADDGAVRHVVVRADRIGPEDRPRVVGMVVDVTATREAAARVEQTLESISDAYYAVDEAFRFTALNRNAEQLLMRSREELVGRSLWEEFPAALGTEFERQYRRAVADRVPVEFEAFYEPLQGWFDVRAYPVPDGGIAVYFRNIDDRRAAEAEREGLLRLEQQARLAAEAAQHALRHQAAHDALTDLANRTQLLEHLDGALAAGARVHVLFVDLDRFKLVNDSLGHAAGDAMLRAVAGRLTALVRRGDVVARIGGDEFVVGLLDTGTAAVEIIAGRVLDALRAPVEVEGQALVMSASIGIAESGPGSTADALLRDADVALYRAKDAGRDQVVWFDERAREALLARVGVERGLRGALTGDELVLHYQPAFDLRSGRTTGAEALLRWQHPERGLVAPGEFIPVAEESGLIVPIGDWVLDAVVQTASTWDGAAPHTTWANVSARQLVRPGLADGIARLLATTGLAPERLGIEITESVLVDRASAVAELTRICDLGVRVALDDFGTGFSSLGRLRELPIDVLKLDRSFVAGLGEPGGVDTVAAIVALGHALGRTVLAEGVETPAQLAALRDVGCDAAAGFLLARPVPAGDVVAAAEGGAAVLAGGG